MKALFPFVARTVSLGAVLAIMLSACDGGSGGGADEAAQPAADLVDFNAAAEQGHVRLQDAATRVLGAGGYAERAAELHAISLQTPEGRQDWLRKRAELRMLVDAVNVDSAAVAADASRMWEARAAFLDERTQGFPWSSAEQQASFSALSTPSVTAQPLLLESLAVATFAISAYRFLKGFGEIADKGQKIVKRTVDGGPEGRAAVVDALRKNGADVPDDPSPEQLEQIFKDQPRDVRLQVTSDVEAWNEEQFYSDDQQQADAATQRFEDSRDDIPQIANEGGAFAVAQVVTLNQAVTGGLGSIEGGTAGAVADLALTATELNPTDIVQRNVTVYVASEDKTDLPPETSPTPPAEAKARIDAAAAGDPSITPEQLVDAANAMIQQIADALRAQFGPALQLAERIAVVRVPLAGTENEDGSVQHDGSTQLPAFENGETVDVLAVQPDHVPQEVPAHVLGPSSPVVLDEPPLLGTLSVQAQALGEPTSDGMQTFSLSVDVTHVTAPTQLLCQGVNAVCSPSSTQLFGAGSSSFSVDVYGTAQVRLVRTDSGESYSLSLEVRQPQPDPAADCEDAKAHLCDNLPRVGCDISVMVEARLKVTAACGAAEANAFFAAAPGMCC